MEPTQYLDFLRWIRTCIEDNYASEFSLFLFIDSLSTSKREPGKKLCADDGRLENICFENEWLFINFTIGSNSKLKYNINLIYFAVFIFISGLSTSLEFFFKNPNLNLLGSKNCNKY